MTDRRRCSCHDAPMWRDGDHWQCRISNRERNRRHLAKPDKAAAKRRRDLAYYHAHKDDPIYQLNRKLRDMTRVRVQI